MTPICIDFAIDQGLLSKDDMRFLHKHLEIIQDESWPVLYHLINHVSDRTKVLNWKDENGDGILFYLLWQDGWFDERWFMSIVRIFEDAKYNFTTKSSQDASMLELAICCDSVTLIDWFLKKGCKFSDMGYFRYCGIKNAKDYVHLSYDEKEKIKTGCDAVQRNFYLLYRDENEPSKMWESSTRPTKDHFGTKWEQKCFEITQHCIKRGYNPKSRDAEGFTLVDYIEKYINKTKWPELYKQYMALI